MIITFQKSFVKKLSIKFKVPNFWFTEVKSAVLETAFAIKLIIYLYFSVDLKKYSFSLIVNGF